MKYLAAVILLALASTLALTPTSRAVAAPAVVAPEEQLLCNQIGLDIGNQLQPPGWWYIKVLNVAPDPWMLFHGTTFSATGVYKGCTFWPSGTVVSFGPYLGKVDETFQATAAEVAGTWQVISTHKTSNRVTIGP